jgi:hypothetical protein
MELVTGEHEIVSDVEGKHLNGLRDHLPPLPKRYWLGFFDLIGFGCVGLGLPGPYVFLGISGSPPPLKSGKEGMTSLSCSGSISVSRNACRSRAARISRVLGPYSQVREG